MIIAAFPSVGKTFFCNHIEGAKDFVCMPYKYFLQGKVNDFIEGEKAKADPNHDLNLQHSINNLIADYSIYTKGCSLPDKKAPISCYPIGLARCRCQVIFYGFRSITFNTYILLNMVLRCFNL